jgi:hypothetical protein
MSALAAARDWADILKLTVESFETLPAAWVNWKRLASHSCSASSTHSSSRSRCSTCTAVDGESFRIVQPALLVTNLLASVLSAAGLPLKIWRKLVLKDQVGRPHLQYRTATAAAHPMLNSHTCTAGLSGHSPANGKDKLHMADSMVPACNKLNPYRPLSETPGGLLHAHDCPLRPIHIQTPVHLNSSVTSTCLCCALAHHCRCPSASQMHAVRSCAAVAA